MAKKHIRSDVKPLPTKRQLSRHRRQQRIQHIIYICGAVFLALLVAFVGYGFWNEQIKPFHQPAVKINGVTYDMDYYVKFLDLYTRGQDSSQVSSTADNLVNQIQYNQAVIKTAPDLGITITDDELDKAFKAAELTNNKVNQDAMKAAVLTNKLLQQYFDKEVPESVEQVNTQALFVEDADTAARLRVKVMAGDNFTTLADEYSLESITRDNGGNLGWLPKGFTNIVLGNLGNSALKDIPFTLKAGEVSEPIFDGLVVKSLGYWVLQVTEKDPNKGSHVRGILSGSLQNAQEIREKILAGDDFVTLVKNYSQDYSSVSDNGDFGWTLEGTMTNRLVMGTALPLEPGEVSQPRADTSVSTVGGYWVVKAVGRDDNRRIDSNTRQNLVTGLFQNWLGDKMKSDSVETLLTNEQKTWAINLVVKSRG